ncbi:hypothetical protein SETIT_2G021200v2 [Setaria italica]|uniref:Uncharacterized protein n=1 Tax=Setaria italica TaxID=4555 RepID=K3ZX40_SETIT|nr:uncharacterized protein LOC101765324 [Setaria italica]RCV09357.1 hypothetical protein SETIT_2G021200v2 [Setaria italica]
MGLCLSSGAVGEAARAAAAGAPRDTALVLLPTGELREYPRPATAARVLEDASASNDGGGWFLCDADRMGFEGPVAAVGADEELRAGQIYFVLPAGARRRGLSREEVAALAVRASAALSRASAAAANGSGSGRRRRGAVAPLVFAPPEEEHQELERTSSYKVAPPQPKRRPAARPGRRLERFASDLTAIPECEMSSE